MRFFCSRPRLMALVFLLLWACVLTGCGERTIVVNDGTGDPEYIPMESADSELVLLEASDQEYTSAEGADTDNTTPDETERNSVGIMVHVCGAVAAPGVYELPEGARIYLAVERAGGFLDTADREWCNQVQVLADGDSLKIYTIEETTAMREQGITPSSDCFGITASLAPAALKTGSGETSVGNISSGASFSGLASGQDAGGRIDLNSADAEQLMTIPGIGKTRAEDILSYRRTHGRFESVDELMQISGIGPGLFEKMKEYTAVY